MAELKPANIREVWDEIRPGLLEVLVKGAAPWRPEDVYAACVSGVAHLYMGEPGFVVLQPSEDKLTEVPELLLWIAYAKGPAREQFQPQVDALARSGGFEKLVMWTTRPGFAKNPDWTKVAEVYERRL